MTKSLCVSTNLLATILVTIVFASRVDAELPRHSESDRPNILFIAIDDMNDWVGFLGGHADAKTPNMDRLAKRGINFTNAHCIAPACSPTRLALLYGVQPFKSGLYPFYDFGKIEKKVLSKYTSLPKLFKDNGYETFGAGKIHHGTNGSDSDWTDYHKPRTVKLNYDASKGYQQEDSRKMAFCPTTNPLDDHPDYQVASYGIDVLKKKHDSPFFLAVGIVKPHLAFVCPQEFFDMQAKKVQKPAIRYSDLDDIPKVGRAMAKLSDDFRFRKDQAWDRVRRSYLACNSWADFNVGRVLDALKESPHADNTIIVLWSDHGYHHGEKRSFRKFSLWEESTRIPMIILDPRIKDSSGDCREAVSQIDLYRTICELTDLEVPEYVDGVSLVPQLNDPETPKNSPAITTWGRGNYAVRSDFFRYIRYFDGTEEFYNHSEDPNEWKNLAGTRGTKKTMERLAKFLPKKEAPLVKTGIGLWNVIDADRPEKLKAFEKSWKQWKAKLKPSIE